MNQKELEIKKKSLRERIRTEGFGWQGSEYVVPPASYYKEQAELSCIDMINSLLCYDCAGWRDAESVMKHEERSYYNYLADYVKKLGRERVVELIKEQINSIASVNHSVFTDSEGGTYNELVWACKKEKNELQDKR